MQTGGTESPTLGVLVAKAGYASLSERLPRVKPWKLDKCRGFSDLGFVLFWGSFLKMHTFREALKSVTQC